ncbi:sigma factor binding protein 1, chloroplastic-like [Corylus avellana]|uniref:sigma factor binding protein 1, chloroplastic-like n=1 Tax=Corylus avellana TaxID=13451 RepID=UPI001E201574|nr:sigma factor binding protein 1, chloroplastic-like [Corylus avellana]
MDNNNQLHRRKPTKKTKSKKNNPIKVVYISNPMKVKTSASQFRALVQELTGQDAELPDPAKFQCPDGVDAGGRHHQQVSDDHDHHHPMMMNHHSLEEVVPLVDPSHGQPGQFEPLDDVFTPQMIESLSGLLPTSVFYESPPVDVLRRLDAV